VQGGVFTQLPAAALVRGESHADPEAYSTRSVGALVVPVI